MSADLSNEESVNSSAASSTKGMTTKVVKGSFWVLAGQVLPMIATFIASPFVIRFLGSESYGVLILMSLISGYFSFADFGMSMASTKFGSEAYGNNTPEKEGSVIRTCAAIAFISSLVIAVPLFFFSSCIVADIMKVPPHQINTANIALKITAVSFVLSIQGTIFNTPQLSRLRMDLNVIIQAGTRTLMTLAAPLVLYYGGGVVEATIVGSVAVLIILLSHIIVSGKLLPQLYQRGISKEMIRPLLKFGGNMVVYSIGLLLLNNMEKLLLTRLISVKSLAYYSIAFTFANMTTMFSMAMVQTLIPAFSQLLSAEKRAELNALFARCLRISLVGLLPAIMFLLVIARPFFTIWAGKEFGEESVGPFYILLSGIFFSIVVYVPNCILLASGRSGIFARFYLLEIIPYALLTYFLITQWGILGAAAAWSIREMVNAVFFIQATRKHTGLAFRIKHQVNAYLLGAAVLAPAVLFAVFYNNFSWWLLLLTPVCLSFYFFIVWKKLVDESEKAWVMNRIKRLRKG